MAKMLMIQIQNAVYAGTAYICGALRSQGHEFILISDRDIDKIFNKIKMEQPDIIGFSCMTCFYEEYIQIAKKIKEKYEIPLIMGGPHPTFSPDETINDPSIDIICRGEGEFPLIELLNSVDKNTIDLKIKNLWFKNNGIIIKNELRPLIDPLDDIPVIDWSCYIGTPVQNSTPQAFLIRGCPYSCSYCFNETMRNISKNLGRYVRHFSVERSLLEIKEAIKVFQPGPMVFTSDSFGLDLDWMDTLLQEYSKITDQPFVLLLRPELATEKCVNILSKYNCLSVAIGVESGSERVRKEILNRNYSNSLLLTVANRLHSHNIKFRTYNMIGLPTETEDEMWDTININILMKTDYPRAGIFTPMPKTKIMDILKEFGYLNSDFDFNLIPKTILSNSVLKNVDKDKIQVTLYFFQSAVIFPRYRSLFRKLTKFRPNIIFKLWFYLIYLNLHKKSEGRTLLPYIQYVWANRHYG
jgi:anaerobic magnesium-protoporphyrin IX monomethyl ester cyclase